MQLRLELLQGMFFFAKLMHGVVKINKILIKTQNKCIVKVCLDFHFFIPITTFCFFCLALCFIVCLQCLHCTLWRGSLTTMSVRTPSTSRAETTPSPLSYSTRVTWSTLSPGLAALMVRICVWNVNRRQNYLMLCKWERIECWNWEIFIYLKICQFQMNQKHFKSGRTGHVYHLLHQLSF